MKIELILIASEILEGKISDLNGQWLARFLTIQGRRLEQGALVRDEIAAMSLATKTALSRSDIVVTSGGIGPTQDDLTKEVYQKIFNLPMEKSPAALVVAQSNYARFDRPFVGQNNGYDVLPQGVTPLNNPRGLAPGLWFEHQGKILVSLPGVPHEFRAMFEAEVWPRILQRFSPPQNLRQHFNVRTKLVPEEKIFGELCPKLWQDLSQIGDVSSLPQVMGIDIGLALEAQTIEELNEKKKNVEKLILSSPLKDHIWQWGHLSLEELIVQTLREKKLTLVAAESCTGGLCSSRLTDVPGSSHVFLGGMVSYSNQLKQEGLEVLPEDIQIHGAVSAQVARSMALGARKRFHADMAFALTGIAGPQGGSAEKPVGTVWIAIAGPKNTRVERFEFKGDRSQLKIRFSQMCFYLLLEEIRTL